MIRSRMFIVIALLLFTIAVALKVLFGGEPQGWWWHFPSFKGWY